MTQQAIPERVVQAQQAADAAWARVEAHRKAVDAKRRADSEPGALRAWTDDENRTFEELYTAARAAMEARARAMADEGVPSTFETEAAIRLAVQSASLGG